MGRGILKSVIEFEEESFTSWKNGDYHSLTKQNLILVKTIYSQSLKMVTHNHLEWREAVNWNQIFAIATKNFKNASLRFLVDFCENLLWRVYMQNSAHAIWLDTMYHANLHRKSPPGSDGHFLKCPSVNLSWNHFKFIPLWFSYHETDWVKRSFPHRPWFAIVSCKGQKVIFKNFFNNFRVEIFSNSAFVFRNFKRTFQSVGGYQSDPSANKMFTLWISNVNS